MFPSNVTTASWPDQVNGTLIRSNLDELPPRDSPSPEERMFAPTKPARGRPHPRIESSRVPGRVPDQSQSVVPELESCPPVKPLESSHPSDQHLHTIAPRPSPVIAPEPIVILAPIPIPAIDFRFYVPQTAPNIASQPTPTVFPNLPVTFVEDVEEEVKIRLQCKQCSRPISDVRDFVHIHPCLPI